MPQFDLTPSEGHVHRRRGRPRGAKSKRSLDLAKYVEAQFGGMTPGQQSAIVSMVTAKEMKSAKRDATELQARGFMAATDLGLSDLMLAMVVKATKLSLALGCERKEAWLLLQKERADLMPYVHQKRPQAADEKPGARTLAFIVPDAPQHLHDPHNGPDSQDVDLLDLPLEPPAQVA